MPEERLARHLDGLDDLAALGALDATGWFPNGPFDADGYPMSIDEYNAWLIAAGRPAVSMSEFLNEIKRQSAA